MPAQRAAHPRISVVIPCFKDGDLAAEAVTSIEEDEPVEIVVVDDASPDDATPQTLAHLAEVRIVRHSENRGLIAARMTGLAETGARYVFPLDADDLAEPGALSAMADVLDRDPDIDVCFGDYREFGTQNVTRAVPERLDAYRVAYTNEYPVSALFRRSALETVDGWRAGGFTEPAYADWNLWIALAERGAGSAHLGRGRITFRKRFQEGRMLDEARRRHHLIYRDIKRAHPQLFAQLGEHREQSDLSPSRKLLYPIVYGRRPRFLPRFERRVKLLLDRIGVWTLRR
jgi:glycosyltransferase involved in cell wall biosynthesis